MQDRIVPLQLTKDAKSFNDLLLEGKKQDVLGDKFNNWTAYFSEVVDPVSGFHGTLIYVPNVRYSQLFLTKK